MGPYCARCPGESSFGPVASSVVIDQALLSGADKVQFVLAHNVADRLRRAPHSSPSRKSDGMVMNGVGEPAARSRAVPHYDPLLVESNCGGTHAGRSLECKVANDLLPLLRFIQISISPSSQASNVTSPRMWISPSESVADFPPSLELPGKTAWKWSKPSTCHYLY
jgi:hypothetical protein